ncbi:MAG: hypothetical protein M1824_001320 [Vezdaea acicularis]|nr:MAG: hypothetical protein M1824_001320 [Vezdaea acicularis]
MDEDISETLVGRGRPQEVVENASSSRGSAGVGIPPEHVNNQPIPNTTSVMSPPPRPTSFHARSTSMVTGSRRGERLSLSFPVQLPGTPQLNGGHTPSSVASTTPATPAVKSPFEEVQTPSKDPTRFLVALAAQERKVLELKEELQQAEGDLAKLKRQWALHEAHKKRNEVRHVEQLQPLRSNANGGASSSEEGSLPSRQSREESCRKPLGNGNRNSHRTVMSGQRHTRTLSLLDPSRAGQRQTFPQSSNLISPSPQVKEQGISKVQTPPSISSIVPANVTDAAGKTRNSMSGPQKDALLRTGRKMAEDFKDGLWTFLDDLRQATVGEEGVNATATRTGSDLTTPRGARKQGSKHSLRSNGRNSPSAQSPGRSGKSSGPKDAKPLDISTLIDVGGTFWKDHSVEDNTPTYPPPNSAVAKKSKPHIPQDIEQAEEDEAWDSWGTPNTRTASPRWSSSTYVSEGNASPTTSHGSPPVGSSVPKSKLHMANGSISGKRDEVSWPKLSKLSTGSFKRTASTLMSEWEKSLNLPAERVEASGFVSKPLPISTKSGKDD